MSRPSIGVPAHVTILFPFVPAYRVDDPLLDELRTLFSRFDSFDAVFARAERFERVLWLAPEPAEPFIAMTRAVVDRWPEHPPYEGEHETIVPHLSVAMGDPAATAEAERAVVPGLPVRTRVHQVTLLEEVEPDWGRWRSRARFPLR